MVASLLLGVWACLEDWKEDQHVFPCRKAADCINGYGCDAKRFVCVKTSSGAQGLSEVLDAGSGG